VQLYPSFSSVRAARIYVLNDLFVALACRQRGVARALLAEAASFGQAVGAARLELSTALTNLPAQRLYESLGWRKDTQFLHYQLPMATGKAG
jgi:ribosomal protein S18 acetylase RimI-like enzyme